jgi:hypothetical protein
MRTIALLSFLSLWTEMAAVHAGEIETESTACGQLITVRATGSSTVHEEKEGSARLGNSAVSGDFLPVFGFISLPECGEWGSHFYGTSIQRGELHVPRSRESSALHRHHRVRGSNMPSHSARAPLCARISMN